MVGQMIDELNFGRGTVGGQRYCMNGTQLFQIGTFLGRLQAYFGRRFPQQIKFLHSQLIVAIEILPFMGQFLLGRIEFLMWFRVGFAIFSDHVSPPRSSVQGTTHNIAVITSTHEKLMLGRAAAGTGGRFHAFIGQGGVIVVEKIATLAI